MLHNKLLNGDFFQASKHGVLNYFMATCCEFLSDNPKPMTVKPEICNFRATSSHHVYMLPRRWLHFVDRLTHTV